MQTDALGPAVDDMAPHQMHTGTIKANGHQDQGEQKSPIQNKNRGPEDRGKNSLQRATPRSRTSRPEVGNVLILREESIPQAGRHETLKIPGKIGRAHV